MPTKEETPLVALNPANDSYNDDEEDLLDSNRSFLRRTTPRTYSRWSPIEEGVTLAWRDLSVYAKVKNNKQRTFKRIINDVTGAIKAGSLVALMGASGAGKSTLLSVLAHRNSGIISEGDILVNGRPIDDYMKYLCGYVHQEDLFVGSLTVLEHMNIMARLKFDRTVTSSERDNKITDILKVLGLSKCSNTRIGTIGQSKTLSGGEKKRLAFATELLTDPPVLFCDEPTTGLDSYSAQKMIKIMSTMATTGKTILCTIHQPSSDIFAMFTQLILLADGKIAYMGQTSCAVDFFEELGYSCPSCYSPADFFIKTLAITPGFEESSRMTVKNICDKYAVSDYCKDIQVVVQYEFHMGRAYPDKQFHIRVNFKELLWWEKLYWLTRRWYLETLRNPSIQALRIFQRTVVAFIVGFCYFGVDPYTQKGIQATQGIIFLFVAENTFNPMYSILSDFPENTSVFMREYKSGLYRPGTYYLSRIISLMPGFILEPLVFAVIAYWLSGLRRDLYSFSMTALITILTMNTASACGVMFSNAFGSVPMAMSFLVPFDYVLMVISGFFVKLSTLPAIISWTKYVSWLMYATESISVIQWHGILNITCEDNVEQRVLCIYEGDAVLEKYSFSKENLTLDILSMFILCIAFYVIGYICLWWKIRAR